MFVAEPATGVDLLAPVQSTPFWTGIFGTPDGTDANGRSPGGGGIATFGFNSAFAGETAASPPSRRPGNGR